MVNAPGQRLQGVYRRVFKHRYRGNAPGWDAISEAERALWADVERELYAEVEVDEFRRALA